MLEPSHASHSSWSLLQPCASAHSIHRCTITGTLRTVLYCSKIYFESKNRDSSSFDSFSTSAYLSPGTARWKRCVRWWVTCRASLETSRGWSQLQLSPGCMNLALSCCWWEPASSSAATHQAKHQSHAGSSVLRTRGGAVHTLHEHLPCSAPWNGARRFPRVFLHHVFPCSSYWMLLRDGQSLLCCIPHLLAHRHC